MFMNGQRVVAHFCEDREMFQKRDDRPPLRPAKTVTMPPADWECSRVGMMFWAVLSMVVDRFFGGKKHCFSS